MLNTQLMPASAIYILHTGEKILGDGVNVSFPSFQSDNDTFLYEDYKYTYLKAINGWHVEAIDKNKEEYKPILSDIASLPIVSLYETFKDCTMLFESPIIPPSVNDMRGTFTNCNSLRTGYVGENVIDISNCFENCSLLTTPPTLPPTLKCLNSAFLNCRSMETKPEYPSFARAENAFTGCDKL